MRRWPPGPPWTSAGEPARSCTRPTSGTFLSAPGLRGRRSPLPTLAVHATGISSDFEDFNHALYGKQVDVVEFQTDQLLDTRFDADGVFSRGSGDPTWAAVLAFVNVDFPGGLDPALYLHPRNHGTLPEALTSVERRSFDPEAESVNVEPSRNHGFLKQLGFVSE